MPTRFLIEVANQAAPQPGQRITLSADRSHYLCKVMRLRRGAQVECFDGKGHHILATLIDASPKQAVLSLQQVAPAAPESGIEIHLGLSLLKGAAMDRAVQQATELGVTSITLLAAKRSNVQFSGQRAASKLAHWQKVIAGACEQSGRLYLPELRPPMNVMAFFDVSTSSHGSEALVLDQHGQALPKTLSYRPRSLLIGPEGGWDEAELTLFRARGLTTYKISDNVMRAETVPAVALALLAHVQS
jgi:16S rRNA (uracil1498-N3)-methyltransferase